MTPTHHLLELEDLLADLRHARKRDDLGRLALIAYCEVRRWARQVGQIGLAERSAAMITGSPQPSREAFLDHIDGLIADLTRLHAHFRCSPSAPAAPPSTLQFGRSPIASLAG